ncbi:hypothetical protein FA95DRAFT_1148752 [Auriscalpium vulgare]|uniref:Uncharacterized protein n=1 Tax=Auriscalpium vulgare TaxID=40419 RepID=A0ACB8RWF5_9AGAM|nr:hypothetical protein FA95DRAFT_1148752 [Auriscalpium vulgare]
MPKGLTLGCLRAKVRMPRSAVVAVFSWGVTVSTSTDMRDRYSRSPKHRRIWQLCMFGPRCAQADLNAQLTEQSLTE